MSALIRRGPKAVGARIIERWRWILLLAPLLVGAALGSGSARADTLDDVLSLLATAGVIDSAVVEAKPVIECVIGGGNIAECADAVAHVQGNAKSAIAPSDPRIKQVVDIFNAAHAGDWLRVFRLGGSKVACGLVPGGAVKDFFCGPIADQIFAVAADKIDAIYGAVVLGDWWGLVKVAEPTIVCPLMPQAVRAALCNELLAALGAAVDLAGKAASQVAAAINNLGDSLLGQQQHISPAEYYDGIRRDTLHAMLNERVVFGRSGNNLYDYRIGKICVDYFDSHTMSKANAQKVCDALGKKLREEVEAGVAYATSAVDAYFLGRLQPHARAFAAAEYARVDDIRARVAALRDSSRHAEWRGSAFQSQSWEFAAAFLACTSDTYYQYPLPPTPGSYGYPYLELHSWICFQAVGEKFSAELLQARLWLDIGLKPGLAGCSGGVHSGGGGQLHLSCDTYQAYRACRNGFSSLGVPDGKLVNHCGIDQVSAVPREASRVARALGAARCRVDAPNTTGAAVVCERSWKMRACGAMVEETLAGLPGIYTTVGCRYEPPNRGYPNFATLVADAASAVSQLNAAIPVRAGSEPACRTLADPLAIRCAGIANVDQANARVAGLALAACPPDPNNDGADVPCYSGAAPSGGGLLPMQPTQQTVPMQPRRIEPTAPQQRETAPVPQGRRLQN